jgi:hypothetical protein
MKRKCSRQTYLPSNASYMQLLMATDARAETFAPHALSLPHTRIALPSQAHQPSSLWNSTPQSFILRTAPSWPSLSLRRSSGSVMAVP